MPMVSQYDLKINGVDVLRATLQIPDLCLLQEVLASRFEVAFLALRLGLSLLVDQKTCFLERDFLNWFDLVSP